MTFGNTQSSRSTLRALLITTTLLGCYQAEQSADELDPMVEALDQSPFERETAGTAKSGSSGGAPTCEDVSDLSSLDVIVRTSSAGGRYAPRNVGAIWIEDADGAFVKTLARWGSLRAKWLQRWSESATGDLTDAVTSATLARHQTHEVSWDLTDLSGCEVAHGDYALLLELADRSGTGQTESMAFTKQDGGTTVTPEDTKSFHDMSLVLH
jgi:hypothetical protein